jgi:hypothetical protein
VSKSKDIQHRPHKDAERALEVVEKSTETAWAMFQSIQNQQERGFEKTRPAALNITSTNLKGATAITLDEVLVEIRKNNRVCPLPTVWLRLVAVLPNKPATLSPVPATREEWSRTGALQKRTKLREHVEWAATQGVLGQVYEILRALPESKWHHMGE